MNRTEIITTCYIMRMTAYLEHPEMMCVISQETIAKAAAIDADAILKESEPSLRKEVFNELDKIHLEDLAARAHLDYVKSLICRSKNP